MVVFEKITGLVSIDQESASGPISRRGWQGGCCLNELAYFQYVEFLCTTAPDPMWIALAAAKLVDFPLKRMELSKSHEIPRVRGDHSDPQDSSSQSGNLKSSPP